MVIRIFYCGQALAVNIDGRFLSNFRFAGDVVKITNEIDELEIMVQELNEYSKFVGLRLNIDKYR